MNPSYTQWLLWAAKQPRPAPSVAEMAAHVQGDPTWPRRSRTLESLDMHVRASAGPTVFSWLATSFARYRKFQEAGEKIPRRLSVRRVPPFKLDPEAIRMARELGRRLGMTAGESVDRLIRREHGKLR